MQLQFKKKTCTYVRELIGQCREMELTDELRLPDNMDDIGRVLGAWGQVLIRGKEWRPDRVGASGGVMVWILYIPENDTKPQMVESWLPFHEQWPIPDAQQDGSIIITGHLTFCDARSVSARKLILRAGLCLDVRIYTAATETLFVPENLPEHVQVRVSAHSVMLPAEAGEKSFSLDEQLPAPPNSPKLQRILRYNLLPRILEQRVSGSRVIFRGTALVHIMGLDEDGQLQSFDIEVPFSQYAQLDREYEEGAEAAVWLAVTNLELEVSENQQYCMKAGMSGQYLIREKTCLEVAEDAYSPAYEIETEQLKMNIPTVIQEQCTKVTAQRSCPCDGVRISDVEFFPGLPEYHCEEEHADIMLSGRFHILYYDRDGQLQNMTAKWAQEESVPCEKGAQVRACVMPCGKSAATLNEAQGALLLNCCSNSTEGMDMISAVTVGAEKIGQAERPAMIVCRAGSSDLWSIAKKTGSTVDAIRTMNELRGEPEPDQILLIPVM